MSAITVYIQGHGYEGNRLEKECYFDDNYDSVQLLSFCGFVGEPGLMTYCEVDGKKVPIDLITIKLLHTLYQENTLNQFEKSPIEMIKHITPIIQKKYRECDILFQGDTTRKGTLSQRPGGFNLTYPINNRGFVLTRPEDEDCLLCPEYGITVVDSTDSDDIDFMLSTPTRSKKEEDNQRKRINWSNSSTIEYWERKALTNGVPNYQKFHFDSEEEIDGYIRFIFHELKMGKTSLSSLIEIFKIMGFGRIYFIDPTCRSCIGKTCSFWEQNENAILESRKPRRRLKPLAKIAQPLQEIYEIPRTPQESPKKSPLSKSRKRTPTWLEECVEGVCSFWTNTKKGRGKRIYKRYTRKHKKQLK